MAVIINVVVLLLTNLATAYVVAWMYDRRFDKVVQNYNRMIFQVSQDGDRRLEDFKKAFFTRREREMYDAGRKLLPRDDSGPDARVTSGIYRGRTRNL